MSYIPTLREAALPDPRTAQPAARYPDRILTHHSPAHDVGLRGRKLFGGLRLWRRAPQPRLERLYWHGLKPLIALALIIWYTPQYAFSVRRRCGIPIAAQVAAQCRLAFREWVNPRCYYFHEHYRRAGAPNIDGYVMRHEVKEGLLKSLHKLRPKVHGERINLGHKLAFAEACADFGLPTPEILALARRGKLIVADGARLEQDLFMKPEQGRGAIGARRFIADQGAIDLAPRLKQIARASRLSELIVQPLLKNHPALDDLAGEALVTIRVFTCVDALGGPVIKDKLFFFGSYQGTRQLNGVSGSCSTAFVLPPLTDDRSRATLGRLFAGMKGSMGTIAGDGSNISPQALALLNLKLPSGQYAIPSPQRIDPSQPFATQGSSIYSSACTFNENQYMANADYAVSSKSRLSYRLFLANSDQDTTFIGTNLGGPTAPGWPSCRVEDWPICAPASRSTASSTAAATGSRSPAVSCASGTRARSGPASRRSSARWPQRCPRCPGRSSSARAWS